MIFIAKYHSKTVRLWKEQGRELKDENDLPHDDLLQTQELAERHHIKYEESPLTKEEYAKFIHHQAVFCRSHTFYKPHETFTHQVRSGRWLKRVYLISSSSVQAFRLDLMIVIVCLLDCHSLFQVCLEAFWPFTTLLMQCLFQMALGGTTVSKPSMYIQVPHLQVCAVGYLLQG